MSFDTVKYDSPDWRYAHSLFVYIFDANCLFSKVIFRELRLLCSVTPTNKIWSDISQMYLLRAKAVLFDWRAALLTDIFQDILRSFPFYTYFNSFSISSMLGNVPLKSVGYSLDSSYSEIPIG